MLWRGDYEGLWGLSGGSTIPAIPIGLELNGGVGPITVLPIQILPTIPLNIHQTFSLGPLVVPDIVIPAFGGGTAIPISVGPITISPITLFPAQNFNTTFPVGPFFGLGVVNISGIEIKDLAGNVTLQLGNLNIDTRINQSFPVTVNWSTPAVTIFPNGISIPNNPLALLASASIGTLGFTIPGFTIPAAPLPLTIDIDGQIDGFSTPPITIDRIPLNLGASVTVGPILINGVNIPATPGFGNTTTAPSSGFFNSGDGGVSGFGNFGAGSSGWWNQAQTEVAGAGSGFANFGSLGSGVLNFGSGVSGLYNTGGLPPGTPAVVSGIGNVGEQLSGLSSAGTALNQSLIINLGLADVGSVNVGFGNVGDFNLGAANIGDLNVGLGNVGGGNVGSFISGNFNNGVLWVGDYQGLFGVSAGSSIPAIPIGLVLNGDIGPITIQPIPILPTIPLSIHQTVNLGPLVVPDIVIPAFGGGIGIPINIGPLTITPITLFAQQTFVNQLPFPTFSLGKITIPQIQTFDSNGQLVSFIGPIVIDTTIPGPTNPQIDLTIRWDTPPITLFPNGISAPDNPLGLLVSVSISNPGFTIPGFSVPAQPLPLSIDIEGQIDGFSTPPITIDRIPLTVGGGVTIGPITIQGLHIPAAPGVGNTTTAPSSG
ncbi:hypothetical protein K651_19600, partial [Mycobacterium tuberculosis]